MSNKPYVFVMPDDAIYTRAEFDAAFRQYEHSADYELRSIRRALTLFRSFNNEIEEARLAAVKKILGDRKAKQRAFNKARKERPEEEARA